MFQSGTSVHAVPCVFQSGTLCSCCTLCVSVGYAMLMLYPLCFSRVCRVHVPVVMATLHGDGHRAARRQTRVRDLRSVLQGQYKYCKVSTRAARSVLQGQYKCCKVSTSRSVQVQQGQYHKVSTSTTRSVQGLLGQYYKVSTNAARSVQVLRGWYKVSTTCKVSTSGTWSVQQGHPHVPQGQWYKV